MDTLRTTPPADDVATRPGRRKRSDVNFRAGDREVGDLVAAVEEAIRVWRENQIRDQIAAAETVIRARLIRQGHLIPV